jgi:hypothetical protein
MDIDPLYVQEIFLQSLRDVIPSLRLHSDKQLITKIGKEKVEDLSLELYSYMQAGAGNMTKNQQLALANKLLICLRQYITTAIKIPFTLKTLLEHLSHLDYAVDNAFPGYASSGLLRYTILPLNQ